MSMEPHTPTTRQVQNAWHVLRTDYQHKHDFEENVAEFNRWLAEHDAQIIAERDSWKRRCAEETAAWADQVKRADEAERVAQVRLERLTQILDEKRSASLTEATVVDALSAFYGEERDGWSMSKVRRMRSAIEAVRERSQLRYDDGSIRSVDTCPEWNCPDLSAEDRREGKKCLDHPCHCVTVESGGSE